MPNSPHICEDLSQDETSQYIMSLDDALHSAVINAARFTFPVGDNPWGVERGRVAELAHRGRYLVLGHRNSIVLLARLGNVAERKEFIELSLFDLDHLYRQKKLAVFSAAHSCMLLAGFTTSRLQRVKEQASLPAISIVAIGKRHARAANDARYRRTAGEGV